MRYPAAHGFYPFQGEELKRTIDKMLSENIETIANPLGAIVPHAGYVFSGSIAAKTVKSAKTDKKTFFILGLSHSGHKTSLSAENWMTPLGEVKVNKKIIEKLDIEIDEHAHSSEHSLEVIIPFLQTMYKDFEIVPMALGHEDFENLEKLADSFPENAFYIASTDFIHFGPMYGYMPKKGSVQEQLKWAEEENMKLIDLICKLKAREFYDSVIKNGYTVCGFIPVTLMILIMKKLGARSAKLIEYKTSYDVSRSSSFVCYAGLVFY